MVDRHYQRKSEDIFVLKSISIQAEKNIDGFNVEILSLFFTCLYISIFIPVGKNLT